MSIPSHPPARRFQFPGRGLRMAVAALGASALLLTGCAGGGGNSADPTTSAAPETATGSPSDATSASPSDASPQPTSSTGAGAPEAGMTDASQGAQYVENAINAGYPLNAVGGHPVVTMYTDYQCPACQSAHPLVEEAARNLDGDVTVVVKNFPLPMHENAVPAARAVEAAGMQRQAHGYASHLYENSQEWAQLSGSELEDYFRTVAQEKGLNAEQFTLDYGSSAVAAVVDEHAAQAQELNLRGTPSFVVAGQDIDLSDVHTASDLEQAFRDAAQQAGEDASTPSGGTARPTVPSEQGTS